MGILVLSYWDVKGTVRTVTASPPPVGPTSARRLSSYVIFLCPLLWILHFLHVKTDAGLCCDSLCSCWGTIISQFKVWFPPILKKITGPYQWVEVSNTPKWLRSTMGMEAVGIMGFFTKNPPHLTESTPNLVGINPSSIVPKTPQME